MNPVYPNFLPRLPHQLKVDEEDEEAWLTKMEEAMEKKKEEMRDKKNFRKPFGIKEERDQGDPVDMGEEEEEEEEDEELEGEGDDNVFEQGGTSFMEDGDSIVQTPIQSDLDMSADLDQG